MRHIGMIVALGTTDVDTKKLNGDVVGESIQIGNTFFEKGRGAAGSRSGNLQGSPPDKAGPIPYLLSRPFAGISRTRVIFAHQRPVELANLLVMEVI